MDNNFVKKLNAKYLIYQLLFFSICAGTTGFGVTYLLGNGFSASQAGMIMASSSIISCVMQPVLGDIIDRMNSFVLPKVIGGFFTCSLLCFASMQIIKPSLLVFGVLYGLGNLMLQMTNSLNNSVCAYYTNRNYFLNYGLGQGLGSLAFSLASLGFGYVIAGFGIGSMVWIVLILLFMLIITSLSYPKVEDSTEVHSENIREERVSLLVFFKKYKIFVATLFGVLMVGMCHAMSENYFIAIFTALGGDTKDVGIAFFIGCMSAVPFFVRFEKLKEKINVLWFLRTAGMFFMIKTVLLILATEVWHVYLIQLLQACTYGFLFQPLYYLARQKVSEADLVKGQAVAISMYLLGTASGGFVGGSALDLFGLKKMLLLALCIAFAGTLIINISLSKKETKDR